MNRYDSGLSNDKYAEFAQYRVAPQKQSQNLSKPTNNKYAEFSQYRITPQKQEVNSLGETGKFIGKSAIDKGLGPLLSIPNLIAQGVEGLARGQTEIKRKKMKLMGFSGYEEETPQFNGLSSNIPTWENIRDFTKDKTGVDFEVRPTNEAQNIASEVIGLATPGGLFGLFSKGNKALNVLKGVGTGATIAGSSIAAKKAGVNPLVADIGASLFGPSLASKLNPKNLYDGFKKVPLNIMGLTGKNFNLEAAQGAQALGVDLPAAALTNSKLTNLADHFVGKTPYFGNKLGEKYLNAENQTKDALSKIYENVGPSRTPQIESKIANLYKKSIELAPEGAAIKPTNLKNALDTIGQQINETAILAPSREKLNTIIETIKNNIDPQLKGISPNIINQFGTIKIPLNDYDIKKLIGTKTNLNEIIKWDEVKGVKDLLRKAQKAAAKDLEEYGKINPEWYKTFKEADNLFGKVAQREKLERSLSGKSTNFATDSISYNALSKAINSPEKNALIKKQVDPETFEKIQKLGSVAKAMAIKNRNIPNPTGTASTNAILSYLGYFYTPEAVTGLVGTAAATKLLTDKKLLDLALKYAEKPNTISAMPFNKRIKEITGYSALALNKQLQREQQNAAGEEE